MIRAKITGVSYKPPRTIRIQYSIPPLVFPLVFQLDMPIEKCDQISDINAAIKADYNAKIQDLNNTYLRYLSQNIIGTEFDFELEDKLDEIDDEALLGMEKNEFIIGMIKDLKKLLPDGMVITYGCENCRSEP